VLLIVVYLLIGSLTASMLSLSEDTFTLNEYVERTIEYQQLYEVSELAVDAVKELLSNDDSDADYFGEPWSQNYTIPIENGFIEVVIVDQERYLNPNYLVEGDKIDQTYLKIFERLFDMLDIEYRFLDNLIDWIDKNSISNGGIEEYPRYKAKNGKLDTIEELWLIGGINKRIYNGKVDMYGYKPGLKDVLTTYSNGKVNVNTASKWVLMSLDDDIDETLAAGIITYRKKKPFKNLNDLNLVDGITGDIIHRISSVADIKSENFLAMLTVKLGDRTYKVYFLLERKNNKVKEKWRKIL